MTGFCSVFRNVQQKMNKVMGATLGLRHSAAIAVVAASGTYEHSGVADHSRPVVPTAHRTGFFHPYLQVLLCEGLVTASEVLLKLGARETASLPPFFPAVEWIGASGLQSKWVWLAIPCMIASFITWLWLIRAVPLNIASLLSSVVHIMVPLSCLLILGEHISPRRWGGIVLVLVGLVLLVRPADHHEDPTAPVP
jgi:drug/metabolite transporter (DMT)-like permease